MNLHEYAVSLGIADPEVHWFDEFVERLMAYKEKYGDCKVPNGYRCPDGYRLGQQVSHVRHGRKTAGGVKVSPKMVARLDLLGFVWEGSKVGAWIPEFLVHLKRYVAEYGHSKVSTAFLTSGGYTLGSRCRDIRGAKKGKGGLILPTTVVAELDVLGFPWITDRTGRWFAEFIKHLRDFKRQCGHCKVPTKHVCPDGYRLGGRSGDVRMGRRGTGSMQLTPKMIAQLDILGFVWDADLSNWFPEFVRHLKVDRAAHGPRSVPVKYICPDGYRLGQRASMARNALKGRGGAVLTPKQITQLDAFGFIRDADKTGQWFPVFLEHMRTYRMRQGTLIPIAHICPDGYPLGRWVNDIRNGRKRGNGLRITSEMVSQLEALGFVWDATTKGKWFQPFMEHLTAYKDAFGDCLIRRSYTSSDGYKLGVRVNCASVQPKKPPRVPYVSFLKWSPN